jgi:TRAP-type C4-dicarboxylate transport system substrate-binding protein
MKRTLWMLCIAGLASGEVAAQTVLTVSSWVSPTQILSVAQKEWCDLLEKNAAGKMKCNILPRGVSAPPGTYDAIRNGVADVSFTVHGYTPGRFVLTQMAEVPFLGDHAEPISVAYTKVAARHPAFAAEHEGVRVIAVFTHGPGGAMNTKRPVARVQDFQGLKWRVGGGMVNDIAKALGMNATLRPGPESYELLSNGIMDGSLFAAEAVDTFRLDKLIKHATFFPGGLFNLSFVFMMNKARYDKLGVDERKAVDAISGETAARIFGRNWDRVDRRGLALMQASGVPIVKADGAFLAEVKSKTAPLEKKWIADAAARGLKDAGKVLGEFRAEIARQER